MCCVLSLARGRRLVKDFVRCRPPPPEQGAVALIQEVVITIEQNNVPTVAVPKAVRVEGSSNRIPDYNKCKIQSIDESMLNISTHISGVQCKALLHVIYGKTTFCQVTFSVHKLPAKLATAVE